MKKIFTAIALIAISLFITETYSQNKNIKISGLITDIKHQPIAFATVVVAGTNDGGISDDEGLFEFHTHSHPPFTLQISSVGFTTKELEIKSQRDLSNLKVVLELKTEDLETIDVQGEIKDQSFSKIDHKLINRLPDAGGGNIEGLIKSQMGVSSNNELSSQYRVRGGNYDENLIYVNDIEIYRPFLIRSGQQEGLSFVNPNLISSLKFSPGGFEAQYGDKMSSVLDVRYKQPKALAGSFTASLLGASAHVEGSTKDQKLNVVAGVRYKTNRYLLGTLDVTGDYNPTFFDGQTFVTYSFNDKFKMEGLGYYATNKYDFIPVDRNTVFGTINEAKSLRIYFEGQEQDLFKTGLGALSFKFMPNVNNQYKLTAMGYRTYEEETYDIVGQYWLQELESLDGTTASIQDPVEGVGVGTNIEHARNDLLGTVQNMAIQGKHQINNHLLSWEAKYQNERFKDRINEWEMRDSADYSLPYYDDSELTLLYSLNASLSTNTNRITTYLQDEFKLDVGSGVLIINAGIRASYWDFNDEFLLSPRVNLLYHPAIASNTRYRFATGIYYQSPLYREIRTLEGELNPDIKSQKSLQFVLGYDKLFEVDGRPFKFTSEAYYKHLTDINPYHIDNVRIRYLGKNNAEGYATGIDFKVNGEFVEGIESWANLSIMKTEEDILDDFYTETDDDGNTTTVYPGYIPRPSDQRVNFSIFFQDYLPNNPTFSVNLNVLFGTGLPFGPPQSERYKAVHRMPSYRRIDIGFAKDLMNIYKKHFKNQAIKNASLSLEIFNLFDISNTISYTWVNDVSGRQYAVPNYLTSRRFNLKLSIAY